MKKGRLMITAVFALVMFCVVGCGSSGKKTLECTMKAASTEMILTANFDGDTVKSMSLKYNLDLSSYSDTMLSYYEKQDLCSTLSKSVSSVFKMTNCNQKLNDKTMVVTSDIDINSFKESELSGSPEATKTALEKQGYTCELK